MNYKSLVETKRSLDQVARSEFSVWSAPCQDKKGAFWWLKDFNAGEKGARSPTASGSVGGSVVGGSRGGSPTSQGFNGFLTVNANGQVDAPVQPFTRNDPKKAVLRARARAIKCMQALCARMGVDADPDMRLRDPRPAGSKTAVVDDPANFEQLGLWSCPVLEQT